MTSQAEHLDHAKMSASDVQFFWIDGAGEAVDGSYHWCVDCPWIMVDRWYGGHLVSSKVPPPGATDAAFARKILETHLQGPAWDPGFVDSPTGGTEPQRWLCTVCSQHFPRTKVEPWPAEAEPCEKCGCDREWHTRFRGPFDRGCGRTWTEVSFDEDGQMELVCGLIHCPCDGYTPPPGGRWVTPSDFPTDGLFERWRRRDGV